MPLLVPEPLRAAGRAAARAGAAGRSAATPAALAATRGAGPAAPVPRTGAVGARPARRRAAAARLHQNESQADEPSTKLNLADSVSNASSQSPRQKHAQPRDAGALTLASDVLPSSPRP